MRSEVARLALEEAHEPLADDAPLLLRVGHAGQRRQILLDGVNGNQMDALLLL
jgi:hypothetical protein